MNKFEELKNDSRSNLIIDLYKLIPTLKEPFNIRYERWIMNWNGQQITITFDEEEFVKYSRTAYEIDERVNHQNEVPLSAILSLGKSHYFS